MRVDVERAKVSRRCLHAARRCLLATAMLATVGGCVELNRISGTRAVMPPTPGFESVPGHASYVGRGDAFRPVGPVEPFRLVMRSEDLIISVGFDPRRSGPTWIGPILPLIPRRLRPQRIASGAPLNMVVDVISIGGPVKLDLSGVRVRLPDGQVVSPICDPQVAPVKSACSVRSMPLTSTERYSTFVVLPLPVDGYDHPSLVIELPVVEVGGRRVTLPTITATHNTKWILHMAGA